MNDMVKNSLPSLNAAIGAMNKNGISHNMADFEKVFEDLDVKIESTNMVMDGMSGMGA